MSQSAQLLVSGTGGDSWASWVAKENANLNALWSWQSGATAPASPATYQRWVDTSATAALKHNNGTPGTPSWVTLFPNLTVTGGGLLPLSGGTMTALINMGGFRIENLGNATADGHAVNRGQVNGKVLTAMIRIPGFNASVNEPVFVAPAGCTLHKAWLISDTATAGSGAGTRWDMQLRNVAADGTGVVDMLTAAFTTNGSELGVNDSKDMGAFTTPAMAEGEGMQLRITKTGTPTDLSAAKVTLVLQFKVAV